jgi:hypothetical protein
MFTNTSVGKRTSQGSLKGSISACGHSGFDHGPIHGVADLKMGDKFLKSSLSILLDKIPPEVVDALMEHMATTEVTMGTACSGTDAPVFTMAALSYVLQQRNKSIRPIKHEFSCEFSPSKRDFIMKVCPELANLFTDVRTIGGSHCFNVVNGQITAVPSAYLLIAGFSCKSVSWSEASQVYIKLP